jgi:hypothetical protein
MFTPVSAFTAAKLSRNSIAVTNVCQKKKKTKTKIMENYVLLLLLLYINKN